MDSNRKFCMEHIQNATLAGGVAVGACADMIITPVGAVIIGSAAGILSTCGFRYLTVSITFQQRVLNDFRGPGFLSPCLTVSMIAFERLSAESIE